MGRFNPRPRRGGDAFPLLKGCLQMCFNPRPRRGGDRFGMSKSLPMGFQSTPPQGGRQFQPAFVPAISVSIHAPAGGATKSPQGAEFCIKFQSTPPQGGRHRVGIEPSEQVTVSIHAPAGGATSMPVSGVRAYSVFQSTPPQGGRPLLTSTKKCGDGFNPRPRRGGDLLPWSVSDLATSFQSTPPQGGRPDEVSITI